MIGAGDEDVDVADGFARATVAARDFHALDARDRAQPRDERLRVVRGGRAQHAWLRAGVRGERLRQARLGLRAEAR